MKIDTYKCDICSVQKQDANRWWKIYQTKNSVGVLGHLITAWERTPTCKMPSPQQIAPLTFEDEKHLCGANCVTEWLSKNLL